MPLTLVMSLKPGFPICRLMHFLRRGSTCAGGYGNSNVEPTVRRASKSR
jgi:hypothetical protein